MCRGPAWLVLEKPNGHKLSWSHLPFQFVRNAHAKLLGSCLHGPANHQPVAGLEYMQRAGDCGKRHGADKDRNFLVQAGMEEFNNIKDCTITQQ